MINTLRQNTGNSIGSLIGVCLVVVADEIPPDVDVLISPSPRGSVAHRIDLFNSRVHISAKMAFRDCAVRVLRIRSLCAFSCAIFGLGWGGLYTMLQLTCMDSFGTRAGGKILGTITVLDAIGGR